MMQIMLKIFSVFIAVVALLPSPAFAQTQGTIDTFEVQGSDQIEVGTNVTIELRTTDFDVCKFTRGDSWLKSYNPQLQNTGGLYQTIDFTKPGPVNFAVKCTNSQGSKETGFSVNVQPASGNGGGGPTDGGNGGGNNNGSSGGNNGDGGSSGGTNTGALKCASKDTLCNPLGVTSVVALVFQLLRSVLLILGGLTVAVIVYGGFQMVLSRGNDKALATAKVNWQPPSFTM
jgi:hypothetical protein